MTYQWQRNDVAIDAALTQDYSFTATIENNGDVFTCVSTNAAGSATSEQALLTVNVVQRIPLITSQPQAQTTVTEGNTATFSVIAIGEAPLIYQWIKNRFHESFLRTIFFWTSASSKKSHPVEESPKKKQVCGLWREAKGRPPK